MNFIKLNILTVFLFLSAYIFTQNSMVGDGFGGRLWYQPTNYGVGSYSAYSICYDDNSQLYAWGDNAMNQLGLGLSIVGTTLPTAIPTMNNVKYFSAGYLVGAIKNDSSGWVWEFTGTGPIQVITNANFVDASSAGISFVKNDGTVWSIGDNSEGQYGDGNMISNYSTVTQMSNITNAVRVACNSEATIILLSDSTLMAVGSNSTGGYLGLGNSINQTLVPLPINGLPPIVDIKSNKLGTIALAANGNVYEWGTNNSSYAPVQVASLNNIVAISACDDGGVFMAINSAKNCYSWGDCFTGPCGFIPPPIITFPPPPISPQLIANNVIDIMAGENFSYFVKSDFSLWAAGRNGLNSGSIWLNLPDTIVSDTAFLQIDLNLVPSACPLVYDSLTNGGPTNPPILIDSVVVPGSINFPNVYSPNNDKQNDEFYFPNNGVTDINWKVYNRWGILIFETNQLNQSWDGRTTAGVECSEGTYYYVLNYKFATKDWERKKGFITLLR